MAVSVPLASQCGASAVVGAVASCRVAPQVRKSASAVAKCKCVAKLQSCVALQVRTCVATLQVRRMSRQAPKKPVFDPSPPESVAKKSASCSKCGPFTDHGSASVHEKKMSEWLAAAQHGAQYECCAANTYH